jgi:hypothetical protein
MERASNKRRHDCHWLYPLCSGQKTKLYRWFWAEPFDGKYTEINYFVQYQKNNLSIALWDLFNTTGIETPRVFNYDKRTTTHLIDLRTSYRFQETSLYGLKRTYYYSGLNDRELNNSNDYRSKHSTYVELSYPLIRDQK